MPLGDSNSSRKQRRTCLSSERASDVPILTTVAQQIVAESAGKWAISVVWWKCGPDLRMRQMPQIFFKDKERKQELMWKPNQPGSPTPATPEPAASGDPGEHF